MSSGYQLAQLNVATALGGPDDRVMAQFMARLDELNGLADDSAGFVWRLQAETGDSTSIQVFGDDLILVNMSVWDSIEHFRDFVYRSAHGEVVRNGRRWFVPRTQAQIVMWWIPSGEVPGVEDGVRRLDLLRAGGPTPEAFTFARPFAPGGSTAGPGSSPEP